MNPSCFLTAITAGLVCAMALDAQAQSSAGPWAKVPALPTVCFQSEDGWPDTISSAIDTVQQAHYRQNEVNDAIRQQSIDANEEDPMAMAQRMQQAMLNDPQNAQKMLEQMTKQGQQAQTEMPAKFAKEDQLKAESKALLKRYKDELATALLPNDARLAALGKKIAASGWQGEGYPQWAVPEFHAILKEQDSIYVAHCGKWWTANGVIHGFMKRYKDFLVLERTPYMTRLDDQKLVQFQLSNVPADGWRSTADYDAAEDYMQMAVALFGQRENFPRCRPLPENYRCG